MTPDELRNHPYVVQLDDDLAQIPGAKVPPLRDYPHFYARIVVDNTRLLAEVHGARADVARLGEQLNHALQSARPAVPPPAAVDGRARPLSKSAEMALDLALNRPGSALDERVIFPGECRREVIEELHDHGLVTVQLTGDVTIDPAAEEGDWWHLGTLAVAALTPLAVAG